MNRWLVLLAMTVASTSQATVSASCSLFGNGTTYTPVQSWPFDTVRIQVPWAPTCTNFSCVAPPTFVGAIAHVEGSKIKLDLYGSDDALPPGVPVSPPPVSPYPYVATVTVGPLAAGTYTVEGVPHGVTNGVVSDLCTNLPPFTTVPIEKAVGPVATRSAVEFYNAARDHYFITVDPREISDLDTGVHPGWTRTGKSIAVFAPGQSGGVGVAVCRFYGLPAAGLDSHFYTANQDECSAIPQKFHGAWVLESNDVFDVRMPDTATGACAGGFVPVYRLWNQRADSNHRFTTDFAVVRDMQARGYVLEGWGPDPATSMCSPP